MKRLITILFILILSALALASCEHTHEFGDWETITDATCSETGIKKRTCECGEAETSEITKKSHDIALIPEVKATCTTKGTGAGAYCKVCGEFTKVPEELPISHSYQVHVATAPSCTREGTNVYTCTLCHSSYAEKIAALGHDWSTPTCTEASKCKVCLAEKELSLGHTVAYGHCDRCSKFVTPSVYLPVLPLTVSNDVLFCKTTMRIDKIDYSFSPNSVTFTLSGQKVSDEGKLEGSKYFCGFSYKLYDKNNSVVASGQYTITDLAVGDLFSEKTLTIDIPTKMSTHYTLVIENYVP